MRSLMVALTLLCSLPAAAHCTELPPRIVMMWQVTGRNYEADFREIRALGVNTVQSFALAGEDPAYVDGYLRAAGEAGLGVVPYLGKFIEGRDAGCALSAAGEDFVRARATAPALLAWHTVDEPANHGISKSCQRRIYERVKAIDPGHPVLVSVNFTKQREYDEYFDEGAFDILDLHRYPNPEVGPAQQRLLSTFRRNRSRDYRVIVTLRAFDAPAKVRRLDMRQGSLFEQYRYFFGADRVGQDVGFYGWRLAPNRGISQVEWLKAELLQLGQKELVAAPER